MNKQIVICGDSFNIGIGCRDLLNEPYAQLLSKHLDLPVKNLAKGSSTNLSIFLQAKYVAEKWSETTELCIVSHTSYDRVEWFPLDYSLDGDLTNLDVNYHEYPPYGEGTYLSKLPNPMKDEIGYRGGMFTENIRGVISYVEDVLSKKNPPGDYYKKFKNEPNERIRTLYDYGAQILDYNIDKVKSIGMMCMAHMLLKNKNIKHLFLVSNIADYQNYIPLENLVLIDWGHLSTLYPDDIPSLHTSKEGHKIVFFELLKKLEENTWIK